MGKYAAQNEWWAIEYNGFILPQTLSYSRSCAIKKHMQRYKKTGKTWRQIRNQGYRTIKARVHRISQWKEGDKL